MRHNKHLLIIIHIAAVLFFSLPPSALSEEAQTETIIGDISGKTVIHSDSFKIDNIRHIVTFTGDVEATRDDLHIKCQKTELFYEEVTEGDNPENYPYRILKIIATEDVLISRPDGVTATAEEAVYYQDDEKVVLTGNPVVLKDGDNSAEGTKITYFLKEETFDVQGSGDSRSTIIFFPDKE